MALGVVVAAPWVSGTAWAASTGALSGSGSGVVSSLGQAPLSYSLGVGSLLFRSCETSSGAYPFPDTPPSGYSLPSWVPSSEPSPCVVLDGSDLREPAPTVTVTESPEVEPSPSPGETQLVDEVSGLRSLVLYSGGLSIFLMGLIAFRSRR